jgi:outer membrane biosynthesis protein TonB
MGCAIACLAGMIAYAAASAQSTAVSQALEPEQKTSLADCEQRNTFANDEVGTMLRDWRVQPPDSHQVASPVYIVIPLDEKAEATRRVLISRENVKPVIHHEAEYPPEAADKGVKGIVKLTVFVAQDGAVKKTSVVCGNPLLVPAAKAAVQMWIYRPMLLNDQPVEFVISEIELSFPPVPKN